MIWLPLFGAFSRESYVASMASANPIRTNLAPAGLFLWLLILSLSGCTSFKTPDEVAGAFWQAMADQNVDSARTFVVAESRGRLMQPDERVKGAAATLGEIRIKGDDARVDTLLQFPKDANRPSISVYTFLRKERDLWKVDYAKTMESLEKSGTLGRVMEDLKALSEDLSKSLGGSMSELQKNLPRYQKQAESLAEKFRKQLEDLSKALEEELKKHRPQREQRLPPDERII